MQIKFMSQTWLIRDAQARELPESTLGLCDPRTNTIVIEATLTHWPRLQTMFHELFHVWEMTMHQGLTEQQVDTMASAMLHCLHENPQLLKMIGEQE